MIEPLEGRRMLSATLVYPATAPMTNAFASPMTLATARHGIAYVQAGQSFTGSLGSLKGVGKKLEENLTIGASINWGDGSAADAGVVTIGSTGVIVISGTHTYTNAGIYTIVISVTGAPPAAAAQSASSLVKSLGTIRGHAIVAPANSSGGITLNESAGTEFTGSVGTFTTIAPASKLHAKINWGDGSASTATLKPIGTVGLDEVEFEVDGSHSYAVPGTFGIVVTVTQPGSTAAARLVTTINSTAIVSKDALNLGGTLTGIYVASAAHGDTGSSFIFTGSGTAGDLGSVLARGNVSLPGFIASGSATGSLKLTSTTAPGSSVTLDLSGPTQDAFGLVPPTLNFVITSGTGRFANAAASGTIAVTLGGSEANSFTFVLTSA